MQYKINGSFAIPPQHKQEDEIFMNTPRGDSSNAKTPFIPFDQLGEMKQP